MNLTWKDNLGIDAPLWVLRKEKMLWKIYLGSLWPPFFIAIASIPHAPDRSASQWLLTILGVIVIGSFIFPIMCLIYYVMHALMNRVEISEKRIMRRGWPFTRILYFSPDMTYYFKESLTFTTLRIDKKNAYFETRIPPEVLKDVKPIIEATGANQAS